MGMTSNMSMKQMEISNFIGLLLIPIFILTILNIFKRDNYLFLKLLLFNI